MKQEYTEVIGITDYSDAEDDDLQSQPLKSKSQFHSPARQCPPPLRRKSKWTIVIADSSDSAGVGAPPEQLPHRLAGASPSSVKAEVSEEGKPCATRPDGDGDVFDGNRVRTSPCSASLTVIPPRIDLESGRIATLDGVGPGMTSPTAPSPLESLKEKISCYVAQVLEIVPDVDPRHCAGLVFDHVHLNNAVVERILHILLEDPDYPRVHNGADKWLRANGRGEGSGRPNKGAGPGRGGEGVAVGGGDGLWMNVERAFEGGINYHALALNILQRDYPLSQQMSTGPTGGLGETPYGPAQGVGREGERVFGDGVFERESTWVKNKVDACPGNADANGEANDSEGAEAENDDDDETDPSESDGEDEENGIECGCCFSKYRFEKMIQCPDAHLFCLSCLRSYSSILLGSRNPQITCMSQSPCSLLFPSTQLKRVLNKKTYKLYERLIQQEEITAANLQGLEECPFCEWKCVMDVSFEDEKLFRCEGCEVTSCRKCKKLDHLPRSCEKVEGDKELDARHVVEEAMTQALMRNCPKCKRAFIKESGCNKMTCSNCLTLSCYICRQIIFNYDHFSNSISRLNGAKCILWDKDSDVTRANEVKVAADKALMEARLKHPEIATDDLKADLSISSSVKSKAKEAHIPRRRFGIEITKRFVGPS